MCQSSWSYSVALKADYVSRSRIAGVERCSKSVDASEKDLSSPTSSFPLSVISQVSRSAKAALKSVNDCQRGAVDLEKCIKSRDASESGTFDLEKVLLYSVTMLFLRRYYSSLTLKATAFSCQPSRSVDS